MLQYGWNDCPPVVRAQVDGFVRAAKNLLGDNLTGVYLHGSLAMGCFHPAHSDVDLLAVTRDTIPVETKRALIERLLTSSTHPAPLEISFLRQADLDPWQHPTPFDLHYGEMWRESYQEDLQTGAWQRWNDETRDDPDLAAHLTITRQRGICLHGRPIAEVFAPVPAADYVDAIWSDLEWAVERIARNPTYFVLNACRVCAYLESGAICSKEEGGAWALSHLPQRYRALVARALAHYRGQDPGQAFSRKELMQLLAHVERLHPPEGQ
jgi:streptomycin 3"-adenylyltransferase